MCQRSNSVDAILREVHRDDEISTTIVSDSETKKVSIHNFKISESMNNSFEINNSGKIVSSDEETSGQDS